MSVLQDEAGVVPELDIADRMRVSLRHAGVGVGAMAEQLGVDRNTVGNWINGRVRPRKPTLRLWALRTGVPLTWLETGQAPTKPGPDGSVRREGIEPPTRCYRDRRRRPVRRVEWWADVISLPPRPATARVAVQGVAA